MSTRVHGSRCSRTLLALAVATTCSLLAASCGEESNGTTEDEAPATTRPEPEPGGAVVVGLSEESNGWQPAVNLWDISGYVVAQSFFDRLMAYDADGDVHPYLAESMTPNDDFTQWKIGLRPDVTFHDGAPLNADALVIHLENMRSSLLWGAAFEPVERIAASGEREVTVTMSRPFSTFPHHLTAQPGYVAAPSQYEDPEGTSQPVGTGPFVFEEWAQGERLTVTRNTDYWRADHPLLEKIDFLIVPDALERATDLRSGTLDVIDVTTGGQVAEFEGDDSDPFEVHLDEGGETTETVILFNSTKPPFDDPVARNAVAAGIDREAVSEEMYDGRYEPALGPFTEDSPWHTPDAEWVGHDPDRARELVAEYEQAHGDPLSFTFEYEPDTQNLELAQLLQQQLADVGIEMEPVAAEGSTSVINVAAGNYEAATAAILWGSQHPDREYWVLHSSNSVEPPGVGLNLTRLENEELDAALDEARTTDDRDTQIAAWAEAQRVLAEENHYVFLVHNSPAVVASDRVEDLNRWEFPDGTPGRPQEQTALFWYQVWID